MELDKYAYCYLNRIYKGEDILAFEMVLADTLFENRAVFIADTANLYLIVHNDDLIKDFDIVDGLLTCSTAKVVPAYEGLEKSVNTLTKMGEDGGSFYDLVRDGAQNDYVIIDDSKIDVSSEDSVVGPGLSKFLNIKISNKTMSLFCKFSTETEIYNKMLVTVPDEEIKFHPFYFGIPITKEPEEKANATQKLHTLNLFQKTRNSNPIEQKYLGVKYVCKKSINEQEYEIYYAEMLQLYTKVDIISSFINKAVSMHLKWTNVLAALKHFSSVQYSILEKHVIAPEWVGGSSSYENNYGVYFETNKKALKKKQISDLHEWLINTLDVNKDVNKTIEILEGGSFTKDEKTILYVFLNLYTQSGNPTELLSLAYNLKMIVEKKDLLMTLYLYEIRLNAFKFKLSFKDAYDDPLAPPVLSGSDEKTYTLVKSSYPIEI